MQLLISHSVKDQVLDLPINYNYILQSILYKSLSNHKALGDYIHNREDVKLFAVSPIKGRYRIKEKRIHFIENVSFEVRCPNPIVLQIMKEYFDREGIMYNKQHYTNIKTKFQDETIESEDIMIKMQAPICVYQTDFESKKTHFFQPDEEAFYEQIILNFYRKYESCYGIKPKSGIGLYPVEVSKKDKVVTQYKGMILSGWKGIYRLIGKRKYLDFLYQTGLGTKNSQGFGMFSVIQENGGCIDEWE